MAETRPLSFTKLTTWQKSHELVIAVYKLSESWPKSRNLRDQIQRAAVSITSNIAEGFGRQSTADKKHFYVMARGSAYEVQNQLLIAKDLFNLHQSEFIPIANTSTESLKLLHGLIRSLERGKNALN